MLPDNSATRRRNHAGSRALPQAWQDFRLSFKRIELIFAVWRAFAIIPPPINVDSMRNFSDLVAAIERGLAR